jgi:hypothetical protein
VGSSYFTSEKQRAASEEAARQSYEARIANDRKKLAAKIIMAVVDKIVLEIVRPGPKPEERECYEMAGELRDIIPDLEALAKQIIDVNDGVE